MPPILSDVVVLDLTRALAGPFCSMMLGDLGASVIKIEQPGKGDESRGWGPPFVQGESAYFLGTNRNKRSLTLNLKSPRGQEVLWRLIDRADVLIENFSPGTIGRLGFDHEMVRQRNPRLVFCSISGFGQTGPRRDQPAYDLILQGMGGFMSVTGQAGGTPTKVGVPVGDVCAGMFAAYSIVAALYDRQRTGEGQYVDTSLLGGQVGMLTFFATSYFVTGNPPGRIGNRHPYICPYESFETGDGSINIAVGNDQLFQKLCVALGLDEVAADRRYQHNAGRLQHHDELIGAIQRKLSQLPLARVLRLMEEAGIPAGPIYDVGQVFDDPQVIEQGLRRRASHSTIGEIELPGLPYRFSRSPADVFRAPPTLGEHTEEILAGLGYSVDAIARLREEGAI